MVVDQALQRLKRWRVLQIGVGNHFVHQLGSVDEQYLDQIGAGAAEAIERGFAHPGRFGNVLEGAGGVVDQRNGQRFQEFFVSRYVHQVRLYLVIECVRRIVQNACLFAKHIHN